MEDFFLLYFFSCLTGLGGWSIGLAGLMLLLFVGDFDSYFDGLDCIIGDLELGSLGLSFGN